MKARDNPFAVDRVLRIRYRFQGELTWDTLLSRLAALDYRAAIVGPDGSGKTTLLEDLAPRLRSRGLETVPLFLNQERRRFPRGYLEERLRGLGRRHIILFDGADHLGRVAWSRFRRRAKRAGGLVITAHRPGLLPTLVECAPSPEILDAVLSELLGKDEPGVQDLARSLYEKHGGNIRDVLRSLYDVYAIRET